MALALFDLDNTLLDGDSDYLWGQYLVEHGNGSVDAQRHARENRRFLTPPRQVRSSDEGPQHGELPWSPNKNLAKPRR